MSENAKSSLRVDLLKRPNLKMVHLDKVNDFIGYALETGVGGDMVKVLFRDALSSDDPRFYVYADAITNVFLNPANIPIDSVHHLLIVIHKDLSADIYANNIPITIMMRPKRDVAKDESILRSDIADIRELDFPGIDIVESDKVIFCFKAGWRFGLYFDVGPREWSKAKIVDSDEKSLDLKLMRLTLGGLYRQLLFYDLYKVLEVKPVFSALIEDGWFPFIEIMGLEYGELSKAYQENIAIEDKLNKVLDSFDEARLARITSKWWKHPIFKDKKPFVDAALKAYSQNDEAGFIGCIKNLWTEVEGTLRIIYRTDRGNSKDVRSGALIEHIIQKGKTTSSEDSLFLPEYFLMYLKDVVFANFDGDDPNPTLNRNTSSHGVANPEEYTRAHALQLFLVLDQIYFYSS